MVRITCPPRRWINTKIVVYGPRGREAAFERLYRAAPQEGRGELTRLKVEDDVTLYFDRYSDDRVAGLKLRYEFLGLADKIRYRASLKLAIMGIDGLIFVADPRLEALDANLRRLDDIGSALRDQGIALSKIPTVITRAKAGALSLLALKRAFALDKAALAAEGAEGLELMYRLVVEKLERNYARGGR